MKYRFFAAMLMAGTLMLIAGCHSHDPATGGHTHGDDSHVHGPTPVHLQPLSFTVRTKKLNCLLSFNHW